jgi:CDP-paratose 2-epimerase
MSIAIVTGSSGLIGSETVKFLHEKGLQVIGLDNNLRKYFFGEDGSTEWNTHHLKSTLRDFTHIDVDIREQESIFRIFREFEENIVLVVHTAAQPSHDWAAREPFTDFSINASGTLVMLEATRRFCPEATFIFTSTNKVYGDGPNNLPLVEMPTRWEIDTAYRHRWAPGIDETMSLDQTMHSIFGASKVAADVMTQEYGRYFGMKTGTFRGGCLTGPAHSGAELHGFLAYLVKCGVTGRPYTIFGYKGKQVRDNIHSHDLVSAFWEYHQNPISGAVYNIGGSRHSNCSLLEAIQMIQELTGRPLAYTVTEQARPGDHMWYVSDVRKFQKDYPGWRYRYNQEMILSEIVEATHERAKGKDLTWLSAGIPSTTERSGSSR